MKPTSKENMNPGKDFSLSCPLPIMNHQQVLLAHGGGGKLMQQLIEKVFASAFDLPAEAKRHDSATLEISGQRIAFTTDSYVVRPLFFPGGDIGMLAVNGTVNDLAMAGARPLYLSAGFILEEGVAIETLTRVVASMKEAAQKANVHIVTGDTKVVDKGKGDGIFINTAGIGIVEHHLSIEPGNVKENDAVIINGDLGRHGMAIMAVREGLEFDSTIESDTAPLAELVLDLLANKIEIHCLRDLTRGGLSSSLNEIAGAAKVNIQIEEASVPIREDVASACELLGLDPLYVANEGRLVVFVAEQDKDRALAVMRRHAAGQEACVIGRVAREPRGLVTMKSKIGASRILDMLTGEQLPRIC